MQFCAGNMWAGLADHLQIHRPMFLVCYVAASLFRFSICLVTRFPVALAICILTALFSPPVTILMDASTMAASAQVTCMVSAAAMPAGIGMHPVLRTMEGCVQMEGSAGDMCHVYNIGHFNIEMVVT